MLPFTERVIRIIQSIPEGKVMSYGQVAAHAGSPRGARQVVRILHSMSAAHKLPWHRIVNARGEIAIRDDESAMLQRLYLSGEGVKVSDQGTVDLSRYGYTPAEAELPPRD